MKTCPYFNNSHMNYESKIKVKDCLTILNQNKLKNSNTGKRVQFWKKNILFTVPLWLIGIY